ncbi:hypothetical protein GQ44DRAFT_714235 [Phaeosphaeriaceae sp. PMI808]|nr:hypothetical protein GQ44DRAFT_714235 [Phaeosphaeriaceae sp. PMI808]
MRLIGCETYQLKEFFGDKIPNYAILSHIWGDDEVSFTDFTQNQTAAVNKNGYRKIEFTCQQALIDGIQYAWVDTCCTIQTHHRRQCPTKRVTYAAENGGRIYIAS